jgi:acyl-CoA synthetase (AMP-forming)/AMP-acid ligase II
MKASSLAEAVELAAKKGQDCGFRFVKNDKWAESFVSYAELERQTARVGGAMQELGLRKGDRLALILPDNEPFVVAFLAAMRAGVVPVPIYPPMAFGQLAGYLDNTRHIVHRSGARALVTTPVIKQLLGTVQSHCPALEQVVTFGALGEIDRALRPVAIRPDDVGFLQFTSGSTARPKGVVLTHASLLANIHAIYGEGLRIDPQADSALAWLPLFHDMGLIGFVLTTLTGAFPSTFLPPMVFLLRPASWLQAMSRYGATMTFGPNFAYALCVKRVREREMQGVDLSRWRVAGCGAEPIRAETLEGFATHFARWGFRKEAFFPAYGLAESTLAVSFSRGVPTDCVRASTLWADGRADACEPGDDDSLRIVDCGKPFEGHEIGVFALEDEAGASPLPERVVGELRVRGPSVSAGYFEEPELTGKAFVGGWFRTGDLGYLAGGRAHVCGRSKELVIVNGRNFFPQDIEWVASQIEGVRKGNVVAFGTAGEDGDSETVVLALETGATDPAERTRITNEVRARVIEVVRLALEKILVLDPGALPKTSSGKLQRTKVRQLYESGELAQLRSAREPDRIESVKTVARSQLEYLKLAVFGRGKKG